MPKHDPKTMFLEAYDAHASAIYRHCYFRVFSKERAEELVQETFMKTWVYLEEGKVVENIRAFLYRVANNLIIDESRKKREDHLDALMEDEGFEPASDAHHRMERELLAKEVLGVIEQLPPEDRDVLVMRYVDDLDPKEIASILDVTPNAVSVRIHRATQSVKNILGK